MPIPIASQRGTFCLEFLLFNRLNISRLDIPCALENDVGEAAQSRQPVTLYIKVNITPPNLNNRPSSIPTEGGDSHAEEATIPGPIQFPAPEHLLPLSHHQPVENGNTIPQSREEVSRNSTKNLRPALDQADEVMERIVPIDRSNTSERVVGRMKWVMDTLGPIAGVRLIPF